MAFKKPRLPPNAVLVALMGLENCLQEELLHIRRLVTGVAG